jgi:type III secretory pathway component EscS
MTESQKLFLLVAIVILAVIVVARYPGILIAFARSATARCRDGSLSFSVHRCGTCSHHGGVAEFLAASGS